MFNYKYQKNLFSLLIILLLTSSIFYASSSAESKSNYYFILLKPIDSDIIIPDDYDTIQEGINNAKPDETIFVRTGVYKENLIVNVKGLSIIGENKFTTIIDAGKTTKDAMNISASDVEIQGFTFINAINDPNLWGISGIRIYSSNVTVTGNRFESNRLGVSVMTFSYNATITNNSFINDGIFLGHYIHSKSLTKEDFLHDIDNNTVDGKPLYYYKNVNNFTVPQDAGQVIIGNCTNVSIQNLYLSDTDFSIILGFCNYCNIENVTVMDTAGEVILFKSNNNTIQNNYLVNNLHGICLDYKSNYNTVKNNFVSDSFVGISTLTSSSYNLIYNNTLTGNDAGLYLSAFCYPAQHDNVISNNKAVSNKIGISINKNSYNNTFANNTIIRNSIGLRLKESSNNNYIINNIFKKNIFSALFLDCTKNIWKNNFWNRPRLLPKIIFGFKTLGKLPIPWINLDKNPFRTRVINN